MGGRESNVMYVEDSTGWVWCCLCGGEKDVKWCPLCKHYFCVNHRAGWHVWERGLEAVKEWMTSSPPRACPGRGKHVAEIPLPPQ